MFERITHALKYHNAVPVTLGALFLAASGALAASPDVRDVVVSSETTVRSVDNGYLLAADLAAFDPKLTVTGVTEDASFFYVDYSYRTVAIRDYVWRDVERKETLAVSKAALGAEDLGVFVARELGQVVDRERVYLAEAQGIERAKGETKKVATTEYGGLVGKFLDPEETVFDGYAPVKDEVAVAEAERPAEPAGSATGVTASTAESAVSVASQPAPSRDEIRALVAEAVRDILANGGVSQTASAVAASSDTPSVASDVEPPVVSDAEPPTITILGNNPATVEVGVAYSDLGATVSDNVNDNLGYSVSVDGVALSEVSIDTSVAGEHSIVYTATDQAGNKRTATRTVIVSAPASVQQTQPAEATSTTTAETASSTPNAE